jgi:hypothetical protein
VRVIVRELDPVRMSAFMGMRMGVTDSAMAVRVEMKCAPPPAHQKPHAEQDDHAADRGFGGAVDGLRQIGTGENDR